MSLTVTAPAYSRSMIFNRKTIQARIAGAFPHWRLTGLHQVRRQGEVKWRELSNSDTNPDILSRFIDQGYEQICLRLDHEHGGEAYPDYYAWELGEEFSWKVSDYCEVFVNQGWRPASILAVLGEEALLEYEMPAGTTALWIIGRTDKHAAHRRNVSYRTCPIKWLKAIEDSGVPWTGKGQ